MTIETLTADINDSRQYNYWLGAPGELRVNLRNIVANVTYIDSKITGSELAPYLSIIIFIGINLFCFTIVAFCYIQIFLSAIKSSRRSARIQAQHEELRMAFKMFAIVFTDFCCWVPLCIVCILTQSQVITVSPDLYAWTVGFILPINSAINPFLYTLSRFISDWLEKRRQNKNAPQNIQMRVLQR